MTKNGSLPGRHLLLDFYDAARLTDRAGIEGALRAAAAACGATVLDLHLHEFGTGAGLTGLALLRESHISVHTWPEQSFAALDIFVCGACDAEAAVQPLRDFFTPGRTRVRRSLRGAAVDAPESVIG